MGIVIMGICQADITLAGRRRSDSRISLGSTHDDTSIAGVIPNEWIEWAVGGNSLLSTSSQVSREHSCILPP